VDTPKIPQKEWNPQAQLAELLLESQFDDHDAAATVSRMMREYAAVAAQSLAHLAVHSTNERVRFQAATYIVDRVLDGGIDWDIKLAEAQMKIFGQALFSAIRELGKEHGFSVEDAPVRSIVAKALIDVSEKA
jgi:hypothetical protein